MATVTDPDAVDRLLSFRPTGSPVLSLYLPLPRERREARTFTSRLTAMLNPIGRLADGDSGAESDDSDSTGSAGAIPLRRDGRLSLRADVARLRGLADRI